MTTTTVLPTTISLSTDLPSTAISSKEKVKIVKLGRLQKKKLLSSPDIDQKIKALGGLCIGKFLKCPEARKQHFFSRLSASNHINFLIEAFFKQAPKSAQENLSLIKAWITEFERALPSEQLAVVNECAGKNLISKMPAATIHKLLKNHLSDLNPDVLTEIAQTIPLFELESLLQTLDIDSLRDFIKLLKPILRERLSLLPPGAAISLKTIFLCVNASAQLLIETKLDPASAFKAIACMPDSEILLLFNNTQTHSLSYFLRLNETLAQKVLSLMDASCERTLTHWLNQIPPTNKCLSLVLEKFTIEAQVDFLFKNPKNFTASELITLLSYLSRAKAIAICGINPSTDLTSADERDTATILLTSLCTTQLIILSNVPEYFAFVDKHLDFFNEETLKDLLFLSKNSTRTLQLLEQIQKDDFKWMAIMQSIGSLIPRKALACLLTQQISKKYFAIKELAPQTLRSIASFKQLALSKTPSQASLISSLFMSTQAEAMKFQRLTSVIKSLERLCANYSMPTLFNKVAAPTLKRHQLSLLKETLQSTHEFIQNGVEWRAQALARSEATTTPTTPTLLSWMSPLESCDTTQVVFIYKSIREALDILDITNQRLTALDYSYEDILEAGLRGDNLRGIKSESDLIEYIELYQALKAVPIEIADTDILIEELLLMGLNKDTLPSVSVTNLETLQKWRSNTLSAQIQTVLAEINITPANLQESGYDFALLMKIGLRPNHFKGLTNLSQVITLIENHRSLSDALFELNIDNKQIAKAGYNYEDLFESGLSGNDLHGVTNKSELVQYVKTYQSLKAISISLDDLDAINTSIETLVLLGLSRSKIETYPITDVRSLSRWIHEALYDSLCASLTRIGISQLRLSALGYQTMDLLRSGLTGQNLQGVTNEAELIHYMSVYQALRAIDISPENLKEIYTSIQTLVTLELRAEELIAPLTLNKLAEWVEKLDLKRKLRTMTLTSVVLERLGYTIDMLYGLGLRSSNLDQKGINSVRTFSIYMKSHLLSAA